MRRKQPHVSNFSSHAAHFTHSSRMFAFFTRSRQWIQRCIVCLPSFVQILDYFILCNLFFAQSSVFLLSHWKSWFSQWVFMSSWANHKESLPVLSFPQWQWESWPRAWALAVALTITYAPLLPVINGYIRFGNKDILGCQGSRQLPLDIHENGTTASFIVTPKMFL